jgi:hypothetical protein
MTKPVQSLSSGQFMHEPEKSFLINGKEFSDFKIKGIKNDFNKRLPCNHCTKPQLKGVILEDKKNHSVYCFVAYSCLKENAKKNIIASDLMTYYKEINNFIPIKHIDCSDQKPTKKIKKVRRSLENMVFEFDDCKNPIDKSRIKIGDIFLKIKKPLSDNFDYGKTENENNKNLIAPNLFEFDSKSCIPIFIEDKLLSNFKFKGVKASRTSMICHHCDISTRSGGVFFEHEGDQKTYFVSGDCLKVNKYENFFKIYAIATKVKKGKGELSLEDRFFLVDRGVMPSIEDPEKYILEELIVDHTKRKQLLDNELNEEPLRKHHKVSNEALIMQELEKPVEQQHLDLIERIFYESNNNLHNTTEANDVLGFLRNRLQEAQPSSHNNNIHRFEVEDNDITRLQQAQANDTIIMEQGVRLAQPNAYNVTKYA